MHSIGFATEVAVAAGDIQKIVGGGERASDLRLYAPKAGSFTGLF